MSQNTNEKNLIKQKLRHLGKLELEEDESDDEEISSPEITPKKKENPPPVHQNTLKQKLRHLGKLELDEDSDSDIEEDDSTPSPKRSIDDDDFYSPSDFDSSPTKNDGDANNLHVSDFSSVISEVSSIFEENDDIKIGKIMNDNNIIDLNNNKNASANDNINGKHDKTFLNERKLLKSQAGSIIEFLTVPNINNFFKTKENIIKFGCPYTIFLSKNLVFIGTRKGMLFIFSRKVIKYRDEDEDTEEPVVINVGEMIECKNNNFITCIDSWNERKFLIGFMNGTILIYDSKTEQCIDLFKSHFKKKISNIKFIDSTFFIASCGGVIKLLKSSGSGSVNNAKKGNVFTNIFVRKSNNQSRVILKNTLGNVIKMYLIRINNNFILAVFHTTRAIIWMSLKPKLLQLKTYIFEKNLKVAPLFHYIYIKKKKRINFVLYFKRKFHFYSILLHMSKINFLFLHEYPLHNTLNHIDKTIGHVSDITFMSYLYERIFILITIDKRLIVMTPSSNVIIENIYMNDSYPINSSLYCDYQFVCMLNRVNYTTRIISGRSWMDRVESLYENAFYDEGIDVCIDVYSGGQIVSYVSLENMKVFIKEKVVEYLGIVFNEISSSSNNDKGVINEKLYNAGRVAFDTIIKTEQKMSIFDDIYPFFENKRLKNQFLDLLIEFILKGDIVMLPLKFFESIFEYYILSKEKEKIDQIVSILDLSVIRVKFKKYEKYFIKMKLYKSLLHLYDNVKNDISTPISFLLSKITQNNRESFSKIILNAMKNHFFRQIKSEIQLNLLKFIFFDNKNNLKNLFLEKLSIPQFFDFLDDIFFTEQIDHFWFSIEAVEEKFNKFFVKDNPELRRGSFHRANLINKLSISLIDYKIPYSKPWEVVIDLRKKQQFFFIFLTKSICYSDELLVKMKKRLFECDIKIILRILEMVTDTKIMFPSLTALKSFQINIVKILKSYKDKISLTHSNKYLIQIFSKAQFFIVLKYIFSSLKDDFIAVLNCHIKSPILKHDIFEYISNTICYMTLKRSESTLNDFKEAVLKTLPELVLLSGKETGRIVLQYFSTSISRGIDYLDKRPQNQFEFLKLLIEKSSYFNNNTSVKLQLFEKDYLKYFELKCKFDQFQVFKFIKSNVLGNLLSIDQQIKMVDKYNILDAKSFLLYKSGQVEGAVKAMLKLISKKFYEISEKFKKVSQIKDKNNTKYKEISFLYEILKSGSEYIRNIKKGVSRINEKKSGKAEKRKVVLPFLHGKSVLDVPQFLEIKRKLLMVLGWVTEKSQSQSESLINLYFIILDYFSRQLLILRSAFKEQLLVISSDTTDIDLDSDDDEEDEEEEEDFKREMNRKIKEQNVNFEMEKKSINEKISITMKLPKLANLWLQICNLELFRFTYEETLNNSPKTEVLKNVVYKYNGENFGFLRREILNTYDEIEYEKMAQTEIIKFLKSDMFTEFASNFIDPHKKGVQIVSKMSYNQKRCTICNVGLHVHGSLLVVFDKCKHMYHKACVNKYNLDNCVKCFCENKRVNFVDYMRNLNISYLKRKHNDEKGSSKSNNDNKKGESNNNFREKDRKEVFEMYSQNLNDVNNNNNNNNGDSIENEEPIIILKRQIEKKKKKNIESFFFV